MEKLDLENLKEEILEMGKWKRGQLENRLEKLFLHLLKWIYQPEKRSRSWRDSIEDQRDRISFLIKKNPSLNSCLQECVEDSYQFSRKMASRETKISLKAFPETMPFTFEEAMDDNWLKENR